MPLCEFYDYKTSVAVRWGKHVENDVAFYSRVLKTVNRVMKLLKIYIKQKN